MSKLSIKILAILFMVGNMMVTEAWGHALAGILILLAGLVLGFMQQVDMVVSKMEEEEEENHGTRDC